MGLCFTFSFLADPLSRSCGRLGVLNVEHRCVTWIEIHLQKPNLVQSVMVTTRMTESIRAPSGEVRFCLEGINSSLNVKSLFLYVAEKTNTGLSNCVCAFSPHGLDRVSDLATHYADSTVYRRSRTSSSSSREKRWKPTESNRLTGWGFT